MIKKIIALIIVMAMLPIAFVSSYAEDKDTNTAAIEAYDVLSALGYINSDYTEDMITDIGEFTRAEFAEMTYKIFGNNITSKEVYYHDVPATHFAAEAIAALVEMNILSVNSDKLFYPDNPITRTEAAKILLYALGYDSIIQMQGGWSYGVEKMASDIKLYKNVTSQEYITYSDMLVLFYNALTSEMLEFSEIKGDVLIYANKGGTYLSLYRDIYLGRGTVTGADGVSIYGDKIDIGKIQIDDLKLSLNDINADEFLGREIDYLYLYDDIEEKVLWMKSRKDDDVLCLNKYDNLPEFSESGSSLSYYTQNGRRKTVNVSQNLNIVFNGSYVTSGVNEILKSDFYEVRLIRSKNSNSYDIAIINDYENYRIVSLPNDNTIYLECCDKKIPNRNIIIDSYDKINFVTSEGSKIKLSEISFNSIVSVFESKDKDVIKLVVSSNSAKGKVKSITEEDDYKVIHMNDTEYPLYKIGMDFDCKIGDEITVLLDMNGRAAMMDEESSTNKFAYLISANYSESDLNEGLTIKMYTKDTGVKKFTAADKIKIDGVRYKDKEAAYVALGEENVNPQVVAYALNSEGEIIMLDLPTTISDTTKKTSDNMLVKIEESSKMYDNLSKRLGQKTVLRSNSVIFGVPSNVETAENQEYSTASVSNLEFETTYDYISYSYTLEDEYFYADVLSMKRNFNVAYWVSTRFAVNKITMGLNDEEEPIYLVEGYHGSEKVEIKMRATCNPNPANLHKGDVIDPGSRKGDEVTYYSVLYCPHTDPHTHVSSNTGYGTGGAYEFVGHVYDIKDRVVKISYDDPSVWGQMVSLQNSKILLYESEKGKEGFREITPAEILTYKICGYNCDKVYVYINSSQMRNFIIFR